MQQLIIMNRCKLLLIIISLNLLISCEKKQEEDQNIKNSFNIIRALNNNEPSRALDLINLQLINNPNDYELKYYKAQAYALKAGVNIYSLFEIIKMKLFQVAMTEWDSIRNYSKNNISSINYSITGDNLGGDKAIAKILEKIDNILMIRDGDIIKYSYKVKYIKEYKYNEYQEADKFTVVGSCHGVVKIYSELLSKSEYIEDPFSVRIMGRETCEDRVKERYARLDNSILKSMHLAFYETKMDRIKGQKETQKIIKGAMALYESAGIIRKLPELEELDVSNINKALEILLDVKNSENVSNRIRNNSVKHIGLLAGYLILESLKRSIDFDKVQSPFDMVCELNPENAVEQYGNIITGLNYLSDIIIDTEFNKKNDTNIKKYRKELKGLPGTLSDKYKKRYIDSLEGYINSQC